MKKITKLAVLLLALLIGLSAVACEDDGNGNGNNGNGNGNNGKGEFNGITATELVSQMTIGWNLGNTLDAHNFGWLGNNPTVQQMETAWVNHRTTRANINAIKNAGFNTIRIPVTWYKVLDSNNNIRADWMARVTEIVGYAVANDMFIIINTHHDESIFSFRDTGVEASLVRFRRIWEQIANNFKDYNEKLIFEGLNEPRTVGGPNEWNGGNPEEHRNLNRYYQVFVDTVRDSGGNNAERVLMINTHAASSTANAMNGLVLPNDTVPNRLIVSIHFYEPLQFALLLNPANNTWSQSNSSDTNPIIERLDRAYNTFVSKGIPVVIGEFGAMNKNNESTRAAWAEFYVNEARKRGMPCIWWDNGEITGDGELFGLLNRSNNRFHYPQIVNALMRGAGVTP